MGTDGTYNMDKQTTLIIFHSVISEILISIMPCNPRFGKIYYFTRIWIEEVLNIRSRGAP